MATVHYGDHEPFEIDDHRADLVAYYRGEGATVEVDGEDELSQIGDASGEPRHGIEHPADGTMSPEISNEPADDPDPRDQH